MVDFAQYLDGADDEQKKAGVNLLQGVKTNPDEAAANAALARRYGLPPAVVEQYKPDYETRAKTEDAAAALDGAPRLRGWIADDPERAKLIHDDMANLQATERTLAGTAGDIGVVAAKGAIGLPQAFVGLLDIPTFGRIGKGLDMLGVRFNDAQSMLDTMFSPAQQQANANVQGASGFVDTAVEAVKNPSVIASTVGQSLPQILGGGVVARSVMGVVPALSPLAAAAIGEGTIGAGSAAEQYRANTADNTLSLKQVAAAVGSGTVTGLLSLVGGRLAQKLGIADIDTALAAGKITPEEIKKGLLKSIAEGGISEGLLEEMPQSAQEQVWQNYAEDKPLLDGVGNAAAIGLMAGAAPGGAFQGIHHYAAKKDAAAREQGAQYLETITKLSQASKVAARDPETFQQFIEHANQDGPVQDVYIEAETLAQSGLADQMAAASPSVAEQLPTALATGGQVRIPVSEYMARIAPNKELSQSMLEHLKVDPEGFSAASAKEWMQSGAIAELEASVAKIIGDKQADDTFQASKDRVKQYVLDQLNAAGKFTTQKNELDASLIAARSAVRASQLGMTPEEFFNQHLLKVVSKGDGGEAFNQFAGQNAQTADLTALDKAKQRIAAGEDAEAVRKDTGWHTGVDGKWRFEISDADAKLTPAIKSLASGGYEARDIASVTYRKNEDGTYSLDLNPPNPKSTGEFVRLESVPEDVVRSVVPDDVFASMQRNEGEPDYIGANMDDAKLIKMPFRFEGMNALPLDMVIDHTALFSAYPALRQVMVKVDPKAGIGGSLAEMGDGTFVITVGSGQQHSTMLHEIQHAIQGYEGFASGGSASGPYAPGVRSRLIDEQIKLLKKWREYDPENPFSNPDPEPISDEDLRKQAVRNVDADYGRMDAYKRLAGEVEARNTQVRANMSDAERNATSPQSTADVAERDQIVTFAKGLAEMVSDKPTAAELAEAQRQLEEQLAIAGRMTEESGGLFAPNGEPSKLSRYQWAQVRTANFKRWFGDWENDAANASKVVDANGEPMVVYHGRKSVEGLAVFDMAEREGYGRKQVGAYFTPDRPYAESYPNGSGNPTVATFLSIKNPYQAKAYGEITKVDQARMDALKDQSYDGVEFKDDIADEYLAFLPNQIKSAIGNAGTFSGETGNILYQSGGTNSGGETQKYTARDWREWSSLPEFQSDDNSTVLFNGGTNGYITEVLDRAWESFSLFDGIFSLRDASTASGYGSDVTAFRINDDDMLSQSDLDHRVPLRKLEKALRAVSPIKIRKGTDAWDVMWSAVIDDKSSMDDVGLDDDNSIRPGSFMELLGYSATPDDAARASWKAQQIRGRLAKELGYKAIIMDDENGKSWYIVPGVKSIPLPDKPQQDQSAGSAYAQTKRGWFNPATNTIALLKNADLSTFLHESAHYFFETDIAIAANLLSENAAFGPETMKPGELQILRDVSALLKWHGIEGTIQQQIDTWNSMGFEERRVHHERTAEAFERYLLEGKAPSIELQSAFQTFRTWMVSVYKTLKDFLSRNPEAGKLNDEVRAVFDRMLATDEEIKLAEQARSMMPLFSDAMSAGMTPAEFAEYQKQGEQATRDAIDELQAKGIKDLKWVTNARSRMLKRLQKEAKVLRSEARAQARMEIGQEPVYHAWRFLTNKMTDEDRLAAGEKPKRSDSVDPTTDSLFEAIAKLGGLNRDEVIRQWGIDPKDKPSVGLFGKPVWRAKDGGRSLDTMVEALAQEGYLSQDEHGKGDITELEERFKDELRGTPQYSVIRQYESETVPGQGEDFTGVAAGRIDLSSLQAMDLPAEVVDKLVSLKMTAKTGGIHPDVLSEILPGWTSGDELVRALAEANPIKEEIERRTDQRMLETHAELATPEAVEMAADMAIHNDARARFLTTEVNALNKAVGQRKVLTEAARDLARSLIGRLRVRDIRPGQYTAAETRAAKAAEKATDLSIKAAEKRNQLLNMLTAKEAYKAKEEVEKILRYLKKFDGKDIRKRINGDYVDQIQKLLESVDLRKQSLTDIDRRKSFGAWVRSQIEQGKVPAVSDQLLSPRLRQAYLAKIMERDEAGDLVVMDDIDQVKILADFLDMAETQSYKDMTVEAFRGLAETVKQIEHLGKKKKSLLTARDGRTYEQRRDELIDSVVANSENLPSRLNRTVPDKKEGRLSAIRDIRISLRKIGMLMRLLDGNKDGGPMWDFFVRSANDRGDWETEMISQSSEALTRALNPVLKIKGGMRGKGIFFKTLNRSLNREERIGLALNVGNEGNLQRLLDGEGWSYADIRPVLESLTAAEWQAVQDVWDHMDSYRPMIAAIERRTFGAEPEWVQPMQFTVNTADGQQLTLKGGYYPVKYDAEASRRSQQLDDASDAKAAMSAAYSSSTTHQSFVKKRSEKVVGRPLMLSMNGVYSGVQDVIHDLAWREWLIDATKMMNSTALDAAIRDKHGAETVRAIDDWIKDIAAGTHKPRGAGDRAAAFMRRNVAAAGLALNVMNAVQNITGIQNSIERIGAKWMAVGQKEYLSSPAKAAEWVNEKSSLMRNRAKTQFRDLNELRNIVENGDHIGTKLKSKEFILMTVTQKIVDTPTWIGAYRKAEAEGAVTQFDDGTIDDSKAVAMADQAVIDAQGSGMIKDLSAIERGREITKLFTVYYSFMNTTYNLAANRVAGARGAGGKQKGSAALHVLLLMSVPVVAMAIMTAVLTPGADDDWDDPKKLAKKLGNSELSYLFGMVPFLREFYPVVQPFVTDQSFGYQGPSGMRMATDAAKFGQQAAQGEFDDGFRKAAVGLSGSLFGLPAAQINRTWTGIKAINDDETDNPLAVVFGFQKPH